MYRRSQPEPQHPDTVLPSIRAAECFKHFQAPLSPSGTGGFEASRTGRGVGPERGGGDVLPPREAMAGAPPAAPRGFLGEGRPRPPRTRRCWPRPYIRGGLSAAPTAVVASPAPTRVRNHGRSVCARPARAALREGRARGAATRPRDRRGGIAGAAPIFRRPSRRRAGSGRGGQGLLAAGSEPSRRAPLRGLRGRVRCRLFPLLARCSAPGSVP